MCCLSKWQTALTWRLVRVRVKAEAVITEDWQVHWGEDIQINRPTEAPATQGPQFIMFYVLECKHELKQPLSHVTHFFEIFLSFSVRSLCLLIHFSKRFDLLDLCIKSNLQRLKSTILVSLITSFITEFSVRSNQRTNSSTLWSFQAPCSCDSAAGLNLSELYEVTSFPTGCW